jgi:UDP-N-acetylmuramate dehydrogenase
MSELQSHISLLPLNTFGMDVKAKWFFRVMSPMALIEFLADNAFLKEKQKMILGGGSNVLFTQDFDGVILHNQILGKELIKEDDEHVWVKVGAGENWHEWVMYCLQNNWGGIENLSLIPGSVGASPIQNIGAYGVELKDVFHSLEAIQMDTAKIQTFDRDSCQFGYRDSIFKRHAKGKFFICSVTFRLTKKHKLHTGYGAIRSELERMGVSDPGIQDISRAVIQIRQSKLPDPAEIGNGGSFFKNPVVEKALFESIQKQYPNMPHYPQPDGREKLAAGWLIEQAGWKGKRFGNYGVHKRQALVLVNYGGANGAHIVSMSKEIQADVKHQFGVTLEPEINLV